MAGDISGCRSPQPISFHQNPAAVPSLSQEPLCCPKPPSVPLRLGAWFVPPSCLCQLIGLIPIVYCIHIKQRVELRVFLYPLPRRYPLNGEPLHLSPHLPTHLPTHLIDKSCDVQTVIPDPLQEIRHTSPAVCCMKGMEPAMDVRHHDVMNSGLLHDEFYRRYMDKGEITGDRKDRGGSRIVKSCIHAPERTAVRDQVHHLPASAAGKSPFP